MNRAALVIALTIAVVFGLLFGLYPNLDLDIAGIFYDPKVPWADINTYDWITYSRDAARWIVALSVAPAFLAICGKLILPRRPMLIEGRAALFLIVTLVVGPGLITNSVLKEHWARPRPIDLVVFGGIDPFLPWWDPRGPCRGNCSFIAGEPAGAFWTLAPAALAPPQWRLLAYAGAIAFGCFIGLVRIAGGGHFFTDVVFSGIFMFLLIWIVHGVIYRWRPTRIAEASVERPLEQIGMAIRNGLARLFRGKGAAT